MEQNKLDLRPIKVCKNINSICPEFTLGKGCTVMSAIASDDLLGLLKAVYLRDKSALGMSEKTAGILLGFNPQPRRNRGIPSINVPSGKVINFKIELSDENPTK